MQRSASSVDKSGSVPFRKAMSGVVLGDPTTTWSSDKTIAAELGKLSLHEREKAYEDVHGISIPVVETPEFVEAALLGMERELALIKDKPALDKALVLSEKFVKAQKFRLGFLRADLFDVQVAANRMVKYFETKLDLFGQDKLVKPILLEDLEPEAQKAVARGSIALLPNRDTLGRAVLVSAQGFHLMQHMTLAIMPQAVWYVINSIADDEASQKKGYVCVVYTLDSKIKASETNRKVWWAGGLVGASLPLRVSSFHHCYGASAAPMMKIVAFVASPFVRVRMRTHQGSHSECQYKLMTFGIPVKDFPVNTQGQLKNAKHKGWVERQRQKENYLQSHEVLPGAVDLPIKYDVLLGKGMPCQEHAGNKRLHELVATRYEEYNSAKRDKKTEIAEELVQLVKQSSGRFLKRDEASGMWVEVPVKEAREKVCHGFRRKREWDLKRGSLPRPSTMAIRVGEDEKKKMKWSF